MKKGIALWVTKEFRDIHLGALEDWNALREDYRIISALGDNARFEIIKEPTTEDSETLAEDLFTEIIGLFNGTRSDIADYGTKIPSQLTINRLTRIIDHYKGHFPQLDEDED